MSTDSTSTSPNDLGIKSQVNVKAGVDLTPNQKLLVGSVLDLFAGYPTPQKLALWTDTASFADPLTNAEGRKQYSAQWYGLAAAFSSITQLHHEVIKADNPIEMELKSRYKVKGLGTEKEIASLVKIWVEGDKIGRVEDRWDGEIPDGPVAKVFRNLNAAVVPTFVSVPKTEEEHEAKKGN